MIWAFPCSDSLVYHMPRHMAGYMCIVIHEFSASLANLLLSRRRPVLSLTLVTFDRRDSMARYSGSTNHECRRGRRVYPALSYR